MRPEVESGEAALERETGSAATTGEEPSAESAAAAETAAPPPEAVAARVASLEAQLELAQSKARDTFAQLKEEHERHLRAVADLENVRKRAQREREEIQKFGTERLLKDLLPVVDNLDRALAAAVQGDPLADGVRLVRKVLEEALAKHGVEVFSAHGAAFDPRLHEALAHLDAADAAPGSVVAEHGRGFLLHGRLLRPALVAVAPPRATPAPGTEPGPPAVAAGEPAADAGGEG
jgi:molecular chaperone GrpE